MAPPALLTPIRLPHPLDPFLLPSFLLDHGKQWSLEIWCSQVPVIQWERYQKPQAKNYHLQSTFHFPPIFSLLFLNLYL